MTVAFVALVLFGAERAAEPFNLKNWIQLADNQENTFSNYTDMSARLGWPGRSAVWRNEGGWLVGWLVALTVDC